MTCLPMKIEKRGYDKSLSTGEIVDFKGKKYVIIFIQEMTSHNWMSSPIIEAKVVGQEVGSPNPQERYHPTSPNKRIFKNGKDEHGFLAKMRVGEMMYGGSIGIVSIITNIKKVDYSFVDVIIEYEIESIEEWSKHKMDKAIKQNRISKFRVINGGI